MSLACAGNLFVWETFLGGLCLFGFLLFFFALIGHLLWEAGRWTLQSLFPSGRSPPTTEEQRCPSCDQLVPLRFPYCVNCGLHWHSATARELNDLATTEHQLNRFCRNHLLSDDVARHVQNQIDARRQLLRHPESPPAPAMTVVLIPEPLPATVPEPSPMPALVPTPTAVTTAVSAIEAVEPDAAAPVMSAQEEPPRRSVTDVLAAFMEERNILWGELVGGLLIVGCSIALVISLWQTLQENPLYQFGIFVAVTAGLFGAGLYTLRHWKLEATSRGLLIIATLLVPLNLLALTTAQVGNSASVTVFFAEGLGFAVFGGLLTLAGRVLAPQARWAYVGANLGISAGQLLVPRLLHSAEATDSLRVLLAGGVPVLCQFLTTGVVLLQADRRSAPTVAQACILLRLLGMSTFALTVALGLVVLWNVHLGFTLAETFSRVAILATLACLPLAVGGSAVHKHLAGDTAAAGWRTVGTAVGLTGMAGMLVAIALAWPMPLPVMIVGIINFVVLTAIAFQYQLPVVHAGALLSLSAGYLTIWHLIGGALRHNQPLVPLMLFSTDSSWALACLVAAFATAAEMNFRYGRVHDGSAYSIAAGVGTAISLIGMTFPALGWLRLDDPVPPMILYAIFGIGSLVCNLRWQRSFVTVLGLALLVGATLWGLWWLYPARDAIWAAALSAEALALGVVAGWLLIASGVKELLNPAIQFSKVLAFAAVLLGAWAALENPAWAVEHLMTSGCIFVLAMFLARVERNKALARIAGISLLVATAVACGWMGLAFPTPLSDIALLAHATLTLAGAVMARGSELRRAVFREPLLQSATVSAAISVPFLFATPEPWIIPALGFLWLAGLAFVIAGMRSNPVGFAGAQSALTVGVIYLVAVWLDGQTWFIDYVLGHPARLFDPRSLQSFGLGLGALSLFWIAARITLRASLVVRPFLEPRWITVDRAVLASLVIAQLLIPVLALIPSITSELSGTTVGETLMLWPESVLPHAFGIGAWVLLAVVSIALIAALWDRWAAVAVVALVLATATIPVLVAGTFEGDYTVLPTLRWGLAAAFALVSALLWARDWRGYAAARGLALCGLALPTVALTLINVGRLLDPATATAMPVSVHMPWFITVNAPLLLIAIVLVGHAFQERAAPYLFAAGVLFHLVASLTVWREHAGGGDEWWVSLLQANVIVASVVVGLWLGLHKRLARPEFHGVPGTVLLSANAGVVLSGTAALLAVPLVLLLLNPAEGFSPAVVAVGSLWGWVAFVFAFIASVWFAARVVPRIGLHVLGAFALGFGVLSTCDAFLPSIFAAFGDPWPRYHGLTMMWFLMLWCMFSLGWGIWGANMFGTHAVRAWLQEIGYPTLRRWLLAIAFLVVMLAAWGAAIGDPTRPHLPAVAVVAVAVTLGCIAFWSRQPLEVYASGLLLNVAGGIFGASKFVQTDGDHFAVHAICLAVASVSWSVVELLLRRWVPPQNLRGNWPAFPSFAATAALTVLGTCVVNGALHTMQGDPPSDRMLPLWIALAFTTLAAVFRAWDAGSTFAPRGLYAAGLIGVGLWLHGQQLSPEACTWTAALLLGGYVLVAAIVAGLLSRLQPTLGALHVPARSSGWKTAWFVSAQCIVGAAVCVVSVPIALHLVPGQPAYGGAAAIACLIPAGMLLARSWPEQSVLIRVAVLTIVALTAAEAGWAMLPHDDRDVAWLWLHDSVILMTALACMAIVSGLGLRRLLSSSDGWGETARRLGPVVAVGAAGMLGLVLIQETFVYDGHRALANLLNRMLRLSASEVAVAPATVAGQPMAMWAVALVVAAFGMLMAAGLSFAVMPGRDPLGLSLRGRTGYIYGVEILLVLLFVHLRMTMPWLFRNAFFAQYWPFIVMAIAFAGVGLSEYFHRRGLPVLAEPLERTGVFLPMLPVLTFWVMPDNRYATLWFLTGLLYGLMSITKRSFVFALLAAVSANIGLWVLLHYGDVPFYTHPQLWLIPPALIALAAEHVNRDRLTPQQSTAIRYLALITIYVSSTADMFIAGLGKSVVMPLVLTVLCIIGVLAGMLLRVRAFLFLGVAFLVVVIGSMIWHAGVDRQQTWILWASGIVLGVGILALFGVFEKRRGEVLTLVEELRSWN